MSVVRLLLALLPVSLFLLALVYLDSYKLVRPRVIVQLLAAGGLAAVLSYLANRGIIATAGISHRTLTIFAAPLVEEILKALPLFFLVRSRRVGFLVDAAILGFAIGAGFSLVENLYYFQALPDSPVALWVVRGFGTAIMHGGSTAIVGMVVLFAAGETASASPTVMLLGLVAAYAIHAGFNSFLLSPLLSAVVVMLLFPPLIVVVFTASERQLRSWLSSGFDDDSDLLAAIGSGTFSDSHAGRFLTSLQHHFEGPVVADMLCLIRLNAELSLRAKGILMMRESGFEVKRDQEIDEKLTEIDYLRKSIGPTGELALSSLLHSSAQDVWQLRLLEPA